MTIEPRRHRITVDEYYRMAKVGILAEDSRVELIQGEIIEMPPMGRQHAGAVSMLDHLLQFAVQGHATVHCQGPVRLDTYSEPVPDLLVLRPREDYYYSRTPRADDVLFLVEVSYSRARYDLEVKTPLYAGHAVPEAWVIDLVKKRLHIFREPRERGYERAEVITAPGNLHLHALPQLSVDLSRLFALE